MLTWADAGLADVWAATTLQSYVLGDDGLTVYSADYAGDESLTTGGSRPTLVGAGPIADGDGTWTRLPYWQPDHLYNRTPEIDLINPTVPNGHFYGRVSDDATSGGTEPTWPTDGGTVDDDAPPGGGGGGGGDGPGGVGAMLLDVYTPQPDGSIDFVGTIDDALDATIRAELNGVGLGSVTLNRNSANASSAMLAQGNIVAVRITQVQDDQIFSWIIEPEEMTLISEAEQCGENVTVSGRGVLSYWERAIWLDDTVAAPPALGWWPDCLDTPPDNARGAVKVAAGTYLRYTVDLAGAAPPASKDFTPTPGTRRGIITSDPDAVDSFTTTGFCAYFDTRRTYGWPAANPDGSANKRFLVHLLDIVGDGAAAGDYFHPHQAGVVEYMRTTGTTDTPGLTDTLIPLDTLGGGVPGGVLFKMGSLALDTDRWLHPMPLLSMDFDADLDSDGNAWASSAALHGMTAQIGETYLSTIAKLVGATGPDIEATFDGTSVITHARNAQGRDLTGDDFATDVVRFVKGVNIESELSRVRPGPSIPATGALVAGDGSSYARALLADAASRVARETFVSASGEDADALEAVGQAALAAGLSVQESVPLLVLTGADPSIGRYLPGPPGSLGHFWLGDTVRLETGAGELDFNETDERIFAITIGLTKAPDATKPEFVVTVELGATIDFIDSVSTPPQPTPVGSARGYFHGSTGGESGGDYVGDPVMDFPLNPGEIGLFDYVMDFYESGSFEFDVAFSGSCDYRLIHSELTATNNLIGHGWFAGATPSQVIRIKATKIARHAWSVKVLPIGQATVLGISPYGPLP